MVFFFSLMKRSKNQVIRNASLLHKASPAKPVKHKGHADFAPRALPTLQQNLLMPCHRTGQMFYRLSSRSPTSDGLLIRSCLFSRGGR
jgi:hypothetical protein